MGFENLWAFVLVICRPAWLAEAVPLTRRITVSRAGSVAIRSHGGMSVAVNRSRVQPHEVGCMDSADCVSQLCDMDGSHGCKGYCVSVPEQDGKRYCSFRRMGEPCTKNADCLSGYCDLTGFYGCKDLCLSEVEDDTRHCRTGHMGDRCSHNNQCLSGVCDTNEEYNCKDLCVSDVLPVGHGNRYCDPKRVGETCNHNENCETGICDLSGSLDEGYCKHRCVTQAAASCPRQQCMPNCDVCLGNLLMLPKGQGMSQWYGYPEHLWDHLGPAGIRLLGNGHQTSKIYARIPASCVEALPSTPCVQVEGSFFARDLTNARLYMQSSILPGFPQPKPEVDTVMSGNCVRSSDGFPEGGNTGCCYNPSDVAECPAGLWGTRTCQSLLVGSVVLGGGNASWENRSNTHDFEEPRSIPFHGSAWSPGGRGAPHDFKFLIDFEHGKYRYFKIDNKWWTMDANLLMYDRDRNCDHVRDWPSASWEFSLQVVPEHDNPSESLSADIFLDRVSVTRTAVCSPTS